MTEPNYAERVWSCGCHAHGPILDRMCSASYEREKPSRPPLGGTVHADVCFRIQESDPAAPEEK